MTGIRKFIAIYWTINDPPGLQRLKIFYRYICKMKNKIVRNFITYITFFKISSEKWRDSN